MPLVNNLLNFYLMLLQYKYISKSRDYKSKGF